MAINKRANRNRGGRVLSKMFRCSLVFNHSQYCVRRANSRQFLFAKLPQGLISERCLQQRRHNSVESPGYFCNQKGDTCSEDHLSCWRTFEHFVCFFSLCADSNLRTSWQQSIFTDHSWHQGQLISLKVPPWLTIIVLENGRMLESWHTLVIPNAVSILAQRLGWNL